MTQALITKDMMISEIVEKYPQAAEVFMEYGLHCVGCHVSAWETIYEGASGHGMDEEMIDMMIKDANTIAQESYAQTPGEHPDTIVITKAAVERVKHIAQKMQKETYVFRVGIATGGCSGFSYTFDIEDVANETDKTWDVDGITVAMNQESYEKLLGCTIDYIDTLAQSGFKIHNPSASTTCGCGSSFA